MKDFSLLSFFRDQICYYSSYKNIHSPSPLAYRSLVNSAITVTNVWKTIQRYFIVHFQFEKTCSFSVHPWENKTVNTVSQQRQACVIWAYSRNWQGVISQNTRNIFDRQPFTDESVQESLKQSTYDRSMYDYYIYRRIGVLVVQALVTRCRARTGAHPSDRQHWAWNE